MAQPFKQVQVNMLEVGFNNIEFLPEYLGAAEMKKLSMEDLKLVVDDHKSGLTLKKVCLRTGVLGM